MPLGALLLLAVLAAPLALRPAPPSLDQVRQQASAAALLRLGAAGLAPGHLEAMRSAAIEELVEGFPPDDPTVGRTGAGAGLAFVITALLAALAMVTAAAVAGRLDADLALISRRVESAGADGELALDGLAFVESVRLAESIRVGLLGAQAAVPMRAPVEDARRQRSHLLASISHDLRSPLNSILGFSELLLRGADGTVDELLRPPLQAIRVAGKRQLRLVHQILEIARLQAGRMPLEPRPTLIAELLRDTVEEFRRAHELPPEIDIETVLQPGMPPVLVDGVRLSAALAQLLGEAVATLQGAGGTVPARRPVRLEASDRREPDRRRLVIVIEAPGGLRPELATSISSAFRVIAPGDLGLSIPLARALIELHDGTLTIEDGRPPRLVVTVPLPPVREHPRVPPPR